MLLSQSNLIQIQSSCSDNVIGLSPSLHPSTHHKLSDHFQGTQEADFRPKTIKKTYPKLFKYWKKKYNYYI